MKTSKERSKVNKVMKDIVEDKLECLIAEIDNYIEYENDENDLVNESDKRKIKKEKI